MKKKPDRNSDRQPNSGDLKNSSTSWWRKLILALTIVLLGGAGGGLVYGWYFVQKKLVPLIEKEASEYLHRPLELGELKSISPLGGTFGRSTLPATATNPDKVTVEKVKIDLNPLYFLRKRIIQIDIILIKPDLYIEQDEKKLWTPTDFGSDKPSSGGGIKVDVETIQFQQGKLTLVARQGDTNKLNPPVIAKLDSAVIGIVEEEKVITFDVLAELLEGGKFHVDGKGFNETGVIDLQVVGKELAATEVSNLLALPIQLTAGEVTGKIGVTLAGAPLPELQGTLVADNVTLQIPNLVKPFSHSQGKLHFQGSKVVIDEVNTNFGKIVGIVNGSLDLAGKGQYNIQSQVKPVEVNKIVQALELEAPVPLQGKIAGFVKVTGNLENPIVNFDVATTTPSRIDQVNFQKITANADLIGTDFYIRKFNSLPSSGGAIAGRGKLELDGEQNLVVDLRARNVSGKAIARSYNNQLPVDIGVISGTARLSTQAGKTETFQINNARANFALGNGLVNLNNLNYRRGKWSTKLQADDVEFGSLPFGKGSAPTIAKGLIDGTFQVTGTSDVSNLNKVKARGTANLNTVGGKIAIPEIKIADGTWQADANTSNLKLRRLFPELPAEFSDNLDGEFYLTGNIPDEQQPQTLINGFGDLTLARGRVKVQDLKIVDDRWQAKATGTNLQLKDLSSATPDQFAGLINGSLLLSGTTDNITPDGIKATGNGSLSLPEGVFEANNLAIANGRFKTQVIPQGVDMSLFADPNSDELELKGQLNGNLTVTGKVDNLSPTAVAAKGSVTFTEGLDFLEQTIGAEITWDGKRLDILQATGDDLDATGYIELDESFFGDIPDKLAAVNYFTFDVSQAQWIDIKKLRLTLPSWATNLDYAGRGDFSGKISGIPAAMIIEGQVNLREFRVEDIVFEPLLTGNVAISPDTGVNLQLAAPSDDNLLAQDQIELILDRNYFPQEFTIATNNLRVTGKGKEEIMKINAQNIPLDFLKTVAIKSDDIEVAENIAAQSISGQLSGDFIFNFNTLATAGENVIIDRPAFGSIRGDLLTGDFQYADGYFAVQNGKFQQRDSIYKIDGNLTQKPDDIIVNGRVSVDGGHIQDVLIALEIFELSDLQKIFRDRNYGDAADLYTSDPQNPPLFNVGLKNAPIIEQLQLIAELQAWLEKVEFERQQALLPSLQALKGTFDGKINVSGSLNEGLNSEFEFLGEQWQWGNLKAKQIIANGSLRDNILTLLPISIELQDIPQQKDREPLSPILFFTGSFGGETQSGQFKLVEVSVKFIEQVISLPPEIALGGVVNATATIAGTKDNPKARGEITIDDASLNQTSVQSTKGSFNYTDARLDFSASSIIAEGANPLTITGNIPYPLPFATAKPRSNRLALQVDVEDKGLTLLDIFSGGEISWIDGQGKVALDISGIFDAKANIPRKLVAKGSVVVNNATIASRTLPDDLLTNVNGEMFFDFDRVQVKSLQGNFGGGKISAAGTLPLTKRNSSDRLTINFDDIAIDLKGLYDGGVKGTLDILGTATEPNLTGDITLFDGTILLADNTTATDSENMENLDEVNLNSEQGIAAATEYDNLQLRLGDNIQISQQPIFTFWASGTLNVNGTFYQPTPEGTIVLKRGQVNLFTTQLNLSRDYENTARFSANNALDPFLDVLLVGSTLETTNSRIPVDASSTEINDISPSSFGTLETVRVSAKVKGLASQITNKIELTSSPPRSQAEIIALLGGSFVSTLGRNTSTSNFVNFFGSALFGSLNREFNNAFPIGELRLFPTQIINEKREDGPIEGLAGEIGLDIFDDFSFSVLKILNVDIPAQFGVRYRLDDNFVLRGSTNLGDDSRGVIEYESRF
jgi:translocation and assembly module TamB